ncbi:MAG: tripartite tricarboxylate transporter TctB family protein [Sporomusaceae bacterium]|nr:tripartite tricarboxylate transporter TctB family protein [Sporomusaceae bacterium]
MLRADRFFSFSISVFCAIYLFYSWRIDVGSLADPQAGFMPRLAGVMGLTAGLALLAGSLRQTQAPPAKPVAAAGKWRFAGCLVSSLLFIPLLKYAGALAAIFLLVLSMTKILGTAGWRQPLLLASVSSAIAYVLFVSILDVPLPRGIFD